MHGRVAARDDTSASYPSYGQPNSEIALASCVSPIEPMWADRNLAFGWWKLAMMNSP
jgi:hypothetical protein